MRAGEILESIKDSADSCWLVNSPPQQNKGKGKERENGRGSTYLSSTPQHLREFKHYLPESQFGASDKDTQYLRGDHHSETSTINLTFPERDERDQGAMDWQNTPSSPLAPSSPHTPRPFPINPEARAGLPVASYVVPPRKDMSIILNGRHTPARADPGTDLNIIDARYAKEIGATISFREIYCPIPLPTFERQIQPIGVAAISCESRGAAERVEHFVVVENFVYQVVLGRAFFHGMEMERNWCERRLYTRDVPVVPYLNGGKETLKCRLDGNEITAIPDVGAMVNVMSLNFATKSGFNIENITAEDDGQIRFADSSVQDIQGLVSVPVFFGDVLPSAAGLWRGAGFSIVAGFYVLEGLNVDVILGEDILSTARDFVVLPGKVTRKHGPSGPILDGSQTLESIDSSRYSVSKDASRHNLSRANSAKQRDMKETERYVRDRERIQNLREKRRAERRNEKKRHEYNRKRAEGGAHPESGTLHYHLCPCKLHNSAKSN